MILPLTCERIWTSREILTARLFWVPILAIVPLNVAFSAVQFNIGAFAMDFGYAEAAATFIMITLGKALGSAGAVIAGPDIAIESNRLPTMADYRRIETFADWGKYHGKTSRINRPDCGS